MALSQQSLTDQILDHPFWYHRIDLGDGFYTPGYVDAHKFDELQLPVDLDGKSVLDIGSYNGLFAFEAERRGADHVLATDLWDVDPREWAPEQGHRHTGFELVREYLDSDVEAQSIDLLDVSPETLGDTFDVVLCPGVIYRLKHLTVGIENLVSVADELVVVTSMYPRAEFGVPGMEFYESGERMNDPSVWWMPNEDCLEGLFRTAGCDHVETSPVPTDLTDDSVPPPSEGVVRDPPVDVYRDHRLTERVERRRIRDTGRASPRETNGDDTVAVLHRTNDAARVMYTVERDGGEVEREQGWVDLADFESVGAPSQNTLIEAGIETFRSEDPVEFARQVAAYLRGADDPREYVAHAYVE